LIHSVDSLKLLKEINKQAKKHSRTIDCLLQMHIAQEKTKFGLNTEELEELISSNEFYELQNIRIRGLMGMATFTEDSGQIESEFQYLRETFEKLSKVLDGISILSMGMSGDYSIAIEKGSTMVRIGSGIFGIRNYP